MGWLYATVYIYLIWTKSKFWVAKSTEPLEFEQLLWIPFQMKDAFGSFSNIWEQAKKSDSQNIYSSANSAWSTGSLTPSLSNEICELLDKLLK